MDNFITEFGNFVMLLRFQGNVGAVISNYEYLRFLVVFYQNINVLLYLDQIFS